MLVCGARGAPSYFRVVSASATMSLNQLSVCVVEPTLTIHAIIANKDIKKNPKSSDVAFITANRLCRQLASSFGIQGRSCGRKPCSRLEAYVQHIKGTTDKLYLTEAATSILDHVRMECISESEFSEDPVGEGRLMLLEPVGARTHLQELRDHFFAGKAAPARKEFAQEEEIAVVAKGCLVLPGLFEPVRSIPDPLLDSDVVKQYASPWSFRLDCLLACLASGSLLPRRPSARAVSHSQARNTQTQRLSSLQAAAEDLPSGAR